MLICLFGIPRSILETIPAYLDADHYRLITPPNQSEFFRTIELDRQAIDCLVLYHGPALASLVSWLHEQAILLPTLILQAPETPDQSPNAPETPEPTLNFVYHTAEISLSVSHLPQIATALDRAIGEFLTLAPFCYLPSPSQDLPAPEAAPEPEAASIQQRRLSNKLKERLGYLGVYYKRSPHNFLRNLPPNEQHAFLQDLKAEYREIVLLYFSGGPELNQKIDTYVDVAFFADIPVSQVVEIHMEIMDEFAKQLKLEGRSEEVLLDYRLTLIDTLAHLCEMYRRSVPRESPES